MDDVKHIERRGISVKRAVLYTAVALFIASTVANTALTMRGIYTGLGLKAAIICLVLGVAFTLIIAVVGNFLRRLIWRQKGYSGTPVAMLFAVNADGKTTSTSDIFINFETMLPRDLLEDLCATEGTIGGSDVSVEVTKVERLVFICDAAILTIVFLALLFAGFPTIGSSALFAMALLFIINRTRGRSFHGTFVQCKYFSDDFGIYYVLRQAAAMGLPVDSLLEEFTDMEIEYLGDGAFDFYGLICWQGIFLEKACSPTGQPALSDLAMSFLKNERLYDFKPRDIAVTRERLNLNNIYMCYTLIHGDSADRKALIAEFYDKISMGSGRAGEALRKEIDWRRAMVAGEAVDLRAYPLFRPVEFMKVFPEYQKRAELIRARIEGEEDERA